MFSFLIKMLEGVEAELNQCEKETKDEEGGRKTWNFIHDKVSISFRSCEISFVFFLYEDKLKQS